GITIKRYMPRAFGRATPKYRRTSHVEVIVKEVT
ncbi:MAG: uL22 family ribosomal protein, partial [Desulfurococcaceae archaeon]